MALLFEKDACKERHYKQNNHHPDARAVNTLLCSHHFSHVDADEENGNATPKDFNVPHSLMNRRDILHENAPHNHDNGEPTVNGMSADKLHVSRCKAIQHHDCRDIPERKFIVEPEAPVDSDVTNQVEPCHEVAAMKARNVVEAGHNQPCGIDAQIAFGEEMSGRRLLHP